MYHLRNWLLLTGVVQPPRGVAAPWTLGNSLLMCLSPHRNLMRMNLRWIHDRNTLQIVTCFLFLVCWASVGSSTFSTARKHLFGRWAYQYHGHLLWKYNILSFVYEGGGSDSISGSLEDLVSNFDEKLTMCFADYQEQVLIFENINKLLSQTPFLGWYHPKSFLGWQNSTCANPHNVPSQIILFLGWQNSACSNPFTRGDYEWMSGTESVDTRTKMKVFFLNVGKMFIDIIPDICHEPHEYIRVNFFGRCKFLQI